MNARLSDSNGSNVMRDIASASRAAVRTRRALFTIGAFALAHIVLALLMRPLPMVAAFHAIATLVGGVVIAARRPVHEVPAVVGYIAASEVLWRMTKTPVFWEFGKYAVCLVLLLTLVRIRAVRNRITILTYFVLLLPSALLTIFAYELGDARELLSFNLSGPLSLMLCVLAFSNIRLDEEHLRKTLLALMGPTIGIAAVAYSRIAELETIEFTANSNPLLSGGFGPNQVSAVLGLALLACLLLLLERKQPLHLRIALLAGAIVFAAQAALTFSRGGIVLAGISIILASMYLVRDGRTRATLVILSILLFTVAELFVLPRLDTFTSGKLAERYTDTDTTGRSLLAGFDLQIFADNPWLGVGPGAATPLRAEFGHSGAAHTEYTRILAEHGVLGALAILFLIILAIRTLRETATVRARAFVVAFMAWGALFLAINAMRLVAPSFALGLACAIAYSSQPRLRERRAT
ncbi:MAG: O-antigen ligase family protein [Kofleriaceae bacterium]|nr:O-antigen ligase family protein [Kofleriaceae bacterium]